MLIIACSQFMNKFTYYIFAFLIILTSNNLISKENQVIFKINNESFTTIDLEKRKTKMEWHKELTNHPTFDWIKKQILEN